MRLGIGSYTYAWALSSPQSSYIQKAKDLLKKAVNLGVSAVQIADNLPLDRFSQSELKELAELADSSNISIEVGTRGISEHNLHTYLRLASYFRSPILRVVIDTAEHHPAEDEIVDKIRAVIPKFERAKISLAIENHDRFPARTLLRIIERIGSGYIGICFDTVNSFGSLEGPAVVLEVLGHSVINLHVKDFSVRRANHNMGFIIEGRPAGSGQLDIPWLIRELRSKGRDPNAILELWTPPEETLSATIEKEDLWAIMSIRYLRTLIEK